MRIQFNPTQILRVDDICKTVGIYKPAHFGNDLRVITVLNSREELESFYLSKETGLFEIFNYSSWDDVEFVKLNEAITVTFEDRY